MIPAAWQVNHSSQQPQQLCMHTKQGARVATQTLHSSALVATAAARASSAPHIHTRGHAKAAGAAACQTDASALRKTSNQQRPVAECCCRQVLLTLSSYCSELQRHRQHTLVTRGCLVGLALHVKTPQTSITMPQWALRVENNPHRSPCTAAAAGAAAADRHCCRQLPPLLLLLLLLLLLRP
jgi:hypothetical protein